MSLPTGRHRFVTMYLAAYSGEEAPVSRTVVLILIAVWSAAGIVGYAHHPYNTYDLKREVTITGDVVRLTYAEPHSFMLVRDRARGVQTVWIAELLGAGRLRAQGVTPESLKAGERVTVTGSPGRVAADRRMLVKTLVRARDGWTWGRD
jgi:hypothetical protein